MGLLLEIEVPVEKIGSNTKLEPSRARGKFGRSINVWRKIAEQE